MSWLIVGIALLVIAIVGGSVLHPLLFGLGLIALLAFATHWRARAAL